MANRPQQLELPVPRTYSRTEFTALRARVKGLSIATIARAYFDAETTEPLEVERLLRTMRDDLVALALREGSSVLVAHLKASIAKHGEVRLTPVTLQFIEEAAGQWAKARPTIDHPLARWFRPLVAERLAGEGVRPVGELVAFINRRGGSCVPSRASARGARACWWPGCAATRARSAKRSRPRSNSPICSPRRRRPRRSWSQPVPRSWRRSSAWPCRPNCRVRPERTAGRDSPTCVRRTT